MAKRRREAFSEGVIAIVVTLMVLEMKLPRRDTAQALGPVLPDVPSYILSFAYVGIYWKNHLDMLHAYTPETGSIIYSVVPYSRNLSKLLGQTFLDTAVENQPGQPARPAPW